MLFLAFAITDPDGLEMEEEIRVLSRSFETMEDCSEFVSNWGSIIESRGMAAVSDIVKDSYEINLLKIGCTHARKS